MNQIKTGSILSYVNMVVNILIGIIYVPLLLRFITMEEYGLYQMIGSLAAYLELMDLGLMNAITRFYSQKIATKDEIGKENILGISLIIFTVLALLVFFLGLGLSYFVDIAYASSFTSHEIMIAKKMLFYLVLGSSFSIFSNVFRAAIISHERFVFMRLLSIIQSLIQPIIVFLILSYKAEVVVIVQIQTVSTILVVFITIWYALKKFGIRIKLHYLDITLIKSMLSFSFFVFIQMIMNLLIWRTGALVIASIIGTVAVAVFSISIQLNMYYRQFALSINSVLFPKIAKIAATSPDMKDLNKLFISIGRLQFIVLGLPLTGFILFGKTFLFLWIGESFLDSFLMTIIIMIPLTFDLIEGVGAMILQAKNLHKIRSFIFIGVAVTNVVLSIILTKYLGALGCAISVGFSLFIGNVIIINIYYLKIGIDVMTFFKNILKISMIVLLIFIPSLILSTFIQIDNWIEMLGGISLYTIVYVCVLWFFVLNTYEKELFLSIKRKLSFSSNKD